MKKLLLSLFLAFFLMVSITNATDITDCQTIDSSGYYQLINSIYAYTPSQSESCIFVNAHNVILDLKEYTITNQNTSGIYRGITVNAKNNITIQNGIVKNFNNSVAGVGITLSCGVDGCSNNKIINLKLIDNMIGLNLYNVSNSRFHLAVDNPTYDSGVTAKLINNCSFNLFVRAKTYGMIAENISNSFISGHFDTNIIVQENVTTLGGNIINIMTIGLIPPTVLGTYTTYSQSKGIGLMLWNSSNSTYQDISALGLISGIAVEKSDNNIFAKIELHLSGKYSGGKFGGIWLGVESVNNTLCEIKGLINDDCNQLLLATTCSDKNNVFYDSCANVFQSATFGTKQSLEDFLLTPLIPITISAYSWVSFIFTPFFLYIFFICGVSTYIGYKTKAEYGLYALIILIALTSMISLTTMWFGLIFIIIMGYMLMKKRFPTGETT